jgi:UDP-N-acetylmuramyl pentapeptide phosphotransferase/UDP-N-acetylglucosamine-1-phosphate transferase
MKLFGKNHIIICIITFAILFLMNYLGNDQPDKIERALMIACAGVIGLSVGLLIMNRGKNDKNPPPDFD